MKTHKGMKLGMLSLSAGLLLAACDTNYTVDTTPVDEGTEQVDETDDSTAGDSDTDEPTDTDEEMTTEDDSETDSDETDETNADDSVTQTQDDSPGIEGIAFDLSLSDAIALFYETFGSQDIHIEEIEFDSDGSRYYYEYEGWDGEYEYEL